LKHIYEDARDEKGRKRREAEYEDDLKEQKLEEETHAGTLSLDSVAFLNSLNEEQLLKLHGVKEGAAAVAESLSIEKFEKLMDSKELDKDVKEKLMDGRFKKLIDAVRATDHEAVRNISTEDLAAFARRDTKGEFRKLMTTYRADGADLISEKQYDALADNKSLSPALRDFIKKNAIIGRVESSVDAGNDAAAEVLAKTLKPKRKVKLKKAALLNAGVIRSYDDRDLAAIAAADKLDSITERQTIITAAIDPAHPNTILNQNYYNGNKNAKRYWT
jgi:hypothetical protein